MARFINIPFFEERQREEEKIHRCGRLYKSCKRTRFLSQQNTCVWLSKNYYSFFNNFVWLVAHLTCCHLQIGSQFYLHKLLFPPDFPISQLMYGFLLLSRSDDASFFSGCFFVM